MNKIDLEQFMNREIGLVDTKGNNFVGIVVDLNNSFITVKGNLIPNLEEIRLFSISLKHILCITQ